MRRWVSLGGWAGPAMMLQELGLQHSAEALPFDGVRSTFDGITRFITSGSLDGYFPQAPPAAQGSSAAALRPDPAGRANLLFRGTHTCFTHSDLNNDRVKAELLRRCDAWQRLLTPHANAATPPKPVTFVRAVIAEDPLRELEMIPTFHEAVRLRTANQLPFRTVVMVMTSAASCGTPREDGAISRPLCVWPDASHPCVVWQVGEGRRAGAAALKPQTADACGEASRDEGDEEQLFEAFHDGIQHVITTMSKEMKWRQLEGSLPALDSCLRETRTAPTWSSPSAVMARCSQSPVSAFRGTCKAVGSTLSEDTGVCAFCGSRSGHAVLQRDAWDCKAAWDDVETDELLLAYAMHDADEVVATEHFVRGSKRRGVNESYEKLQELLGKEVVSVPMAPPAEEAP